MSLRLRGEILVVLTLVAKIPFHQGALAGKFDVKELYKQSATRLDESF